MMKSGLFEFPQKGLCSIALICLGCCIVGTISYEIRADGTDIKQVNGDRIAADYPLKPVPFNKVELLSDFWRPRLVTQREVLVPFAFERTQPGVDHLKAARDFLAGNTVEGHRPHRFIDSDLYKVMEGAAYLLQLRQDPELEAKLDELADDH